MSTRPEVLSARQAVARALTQGPADLNTIASRIGPVFSRRSIDEGLAGLRDRGRVERLSPTPYGAVWRLLPPPADAALVDDIRAELARLEAEAVDGLNLAHHDNARRLVEVDNALRLAAVLARAAQRIESIA